MRIESNIHLLTRAAYGMHLADQMALACVPIIAALVFNASPEMIGVLIACQSSAYLFGSIPFGVLVDRYQLRSLALAATLASATGLGLSALSVMAGSLLGFGFAVTMAGLGIVLFVLTLSSIVSRTVPVDRLGAANAEVELPRALASFLVPLLVGFVIARGNSHLVLLVGAIGGMWAAVMALRLPTFQTGVTSIEGVLRKISVGGAFVLKSAPLSAIATCAVFWNFAFSALLVVMVPLLRDEYGADPGVFGSSLAMFGLGAILGTWLMRKNGNRTRPGLVLIFGPAVSLLALACIFVLPRLGFLEGVYLGFFLLGFGPSMWLIVQNSVRQIVTPKDMLGRVNAVIQTTIYGVRPIGALTAGVVVGAFSPAVGLALVTSAYAASLLAIALSDLKSVREYHELVVT